MPLTFHNLKIPPKKIQLIQLEHFHPSLIETIDYIILTSQKNGVLKLNQSTVLIDIPRAGCIFTDRLKKDNLFAQEIIANTGVSRNPHKGILPMISKSQTHFVMSDMYIVTGKTLVAILLDLETQKIPIKKITIIVLGVTELFFKADNLLRVFAKQAKYDISVIAGYQENITKLKIQNQEEVILGKVSKTKYGKFIYQMGDFGEFTKEAIAQGLISAEHSHQSFSWLQSLKAFFN